MNAIAVGGLNFSSLNTAAKAAPPIFQTAAELHDYYKDRVKSLENDLEDALNVIENLRQEKHTLIQSVRILSNHDDSC